MQISRRKSLSSLLVTLGVFGKTLIANEPRPNFVHSSGVDEFTRKLREAESLVNFFYLMNTKETQVNDGFCGPTSVCMAINSLPAIDRRKFVRCSDIWGQPKSQFRRALIFEHKKYKSLSQWTWFINSVSRIKPAEEVSKSGYTLGELYDALRAFDSEMNLGLTPSLYYADQLPLDDFKTLARNTLSSENRRIIVNYDRTIVHQPGAGHLSCLAAYHELTDSFLIYDTASAFKSRDLGSTPIWSEWIPSSEIHSAMLSHDGKHSRGLIIITLEQ